MVIANKHLLDLSPAVRTVVRLQKFPQLKLPRRGAEVDSDIARYFEFIDHHRLVDFDGDVVLLFKKCAEFLKVARES